MNHESKDDMSPDERLAWLREHGIEVVTPDERKATQVVHALRQADGVPVTYVRIPCDASQPLQELSFVPANNNNTDALAEHLRATFADSDAHVDVTLLQQQSGGLHSLTNANIPPPSVATLQQVAQQGQVETFALVHATVSNQHVAVNLYLDEAGLLKRLPLNARAAAFARRAGYEPPPHFYGDVYLGRIFRQGSSSRPMSIAVGQDTALDSPPSWLQQAASDNITRQLEMNRITGQTGQEQSSVVGSAGQAATGDGYTWTQTEQELEVQVLVAAGTNSNSTTVKFQPQTMTVHVAPENTTVLRLHLFERVDVDGCTWTLDGTTLTITMEKAEEALWPRLLD